MDNEDSKRESCIDASLRFCDEYIIDFYNINEEVIGIPTRSRRLESLREERKLGNRGEVNNVSQNP